MNAASDLVVIPKENALAVYSADCGLDPYLQKIRKEIESFVPDVSTKKGRDAIASIAYKVARSKTALDGVGKELVSDLKEIPKKIDAERKRMRDLLDSWQTEVRKPLTDWEDAEKSRIARIQERVFQLKDFSVVSDLSAAGIQVQIDNLESVKVGPDFEEFEAEAHRVKAESMESLKVAHSARCKYESEQAELDRLRAEAAARELKEREERIARDAAEKAKREAEEKANAEREAAIRREAEAKADAEKRELELKLAAERAEREKAEAQRRAEQAERDAADRAESAAQAERQRQADEQAKIEAEARAREADKAHKKSVNNAALDDLVAGGLTKECAKQAITMIAQGKVSNVCIKY